MEHPLRVIKGQSGFQKTLYRGIKKTIIRAPRKIAICRETGSDKPSPKYESLMGQPREIGIFRGAHKPKMLFALVNLYEIRERRLAKA
jgi:hypothetical protein